MTQTMQQNIAADSLQPATFQSDSGKQQDTLPEYGSPSIKRNVISLFLLQCANYVFPLLTLPWLTRVLGPDSFGRVGFATAFCMYFSLFSDYGFNLSATRLIAIHRDDRVARSRIFWATLLTKVILAIAGFLLLLVLTSLVPRLTQERTLLLAGYLSVVGTVLTPLWYFQGIERMSVLTVVNLISRFTTLPLIFLLVRGKSDVLLAMLTISGTGLLAGCLSMGALMRLKQICWLPPSLIDVRHSLHDGWHIFVSSAAVSLYTTSNTVVLGFVAGNVEVGYFSAMERIVRSIQNLTAPLSQAVYPRISHLMHYSRNEAFVLIRKLIRLQGIITFAISFALLIFAKSLIGIVFGPSYLVSVSTLKWLAPLPFLIGLSNVFGVQTMLPLGHKAAFSGILLASGILNLAMIIPLGSHFGATGASASILITEILVTIAMGAYLRMHSVPIFRDNITLTARDEYES